MMSFMVEFIIGTKPLDKNKILFYDVYRTKLIIEQNSRATMTVVVDEMSRIARNMQIGPAYAQRLSHYPYRDSSLLSFKCLCLRHSGLPCKLNHLIFFGV